MCAQSSTSFCKTHGGGIRCASEGCKKAAVGVALGGERRCLTHGGGRCSEPDCTRMARAGCVPHPYLIMLDAPPSSPWRGEGAPRFAGERGFTSPGAKRTPSSTTQSQSWCVCSARLVSLGDAPDSAGTGRQTEGELGRGLA